MDASSRGDASTWRAWLEQSGAEIAGYLAPTVHTLLPLHLARADLRMGLGDPPRAVLAELLGATRCWAENAPLYLHTLPLHRLRSRRLVPLELALLTGDAPSVTALADSVATDAMSVIAGTADAALTRELDAVAGGPLADPPADPVGLAGRLGLLYWLALGAVVRGERHAFDATLLMAASLLAAAPSPPAGPLARLAALHAALAALPAGDPDACAQALATHARLHDAEAPARAAAAGPGDPPSSGALDLPGLALAQVAAAFGLDVRDGLRARDASPYGPARLGLLDLLGA